MEIEQVKQRIRQRGGTLAFVLTWIARLHDVVRANSWLVDRPLALQGGPVTIVVEFRQRGARALIPTVLKPTMALKPGTIPLIIQDNRILLRGQDRVQTSGLRRP